VRGAKAAVPGRSAQSLAESHGKRYAIWRICRPFRRASLSGGFGVHNF